MNDLIKEIYKMILELRKVSEANNELLGFVCQKVAPSKIVNKESVDVEEMLTISMEMSEIFDKYDVMPEDFGVA